MPRADRAQRFLIDPLAVTRDPARRKLSPAARGVYDTLWLESWLEKTPGHLPADETLLAGLAQVTRDEWVTVRDSVRDMFEVTPENWICRAVTRTKNEQDEKRDRWRNRKSAQRLRERDSRVTSNGDESGQSPVGSGSGSGSGTGSRVLESESKAQTAATSGERASPVRSLLPDVAALAKDHGADATSSACALATRLAKSGVMHRGLLLAFVRHFLEHRQRIANVYAYYSPGGAGFEAMKMRLAADNAFDEHEAIKRAELAWRRS